MTLICKPRGRGNWHAIVLEISMRQPDLFPRLRIQALRAGESITVGQLVLRICEVRP